VILPVETHSFRTRDGIELAVRRIRSEDATRGAVILQHGLAANGMVYDLPGRSLARYLAEAGYDCFIPQLRGAAASCGSYGLDAYLDYDLPAILEQVQALSGKSELAYVGHSMGGLLMLMHAIDHPDAAISRFVGVGSTLDYQPDALALKAQRWMLPIAKRALRSMPFRVLARANALVAGYGPVLPVENLNFARANIEPYLMRKLIAEGMTDIPMELLLDLDTTFQEGGFVRRRGELSYLPRAGAFRVPSLLLVGTADTQCGEASVDATARLLTGVPRLRVVRLGRAHGQAQDYGHFDLIAGTRANAEVWPILAEFLAPDEPT
jgi:alpha-beta hydrolase superfamily lysophospholipase